jgi:hypothetical protein
MSPVPCRRSSRQSGRCRARVDTDGEAIAPIPAARRTRSRKR